jgi:hypothetical protein
MMTIEQAKAKTSRMQDLNFMYKTARARNDEATARQHLDEMKRIRDELNAEPTKPMRRDELEVGNDAQVAERRAQQSAAQERVRETQRAPLPNSLAAKMTDAERAKPPSARPLPNSIAMSTRR